MYKATSGENSFDILANDMGILVNGDPFSWDLIKVEENAFHILYKNKSYLAKIVYVDHQNKSYKIKINHKLYEIVLKDQFDLLLEKMGISNNQAGKMRSVKAPMPGLIIELKVKDGDQVMKDDPLLVLEAMKMENVIKSPSDGVVRVVNVKKGESVEKNQVLIEF